MIECVISNNCGTKSSSFDPPSEESTFHNGDAIHDRGMKNSSFDPGQKPPQHQHKYSGEEAVLIMDSNMNYIKEDQFWSSTYKLKCGRAELLEGRLKNVDFSEAKHIIIGTGTNDVEKGLSASSIFKDLVRSAQKLASQHKDAHVYIAQLPPMKGEFETPMKELNILIKSDVPETIRTILQEDIQENDMYDHKHVLIKKIGKMVRNMKNAMRNAAGIPETSRDRGMNSRRNQPMKQEDEKNNAEYSLINKVLSAVQESMKLSNEQLLIGLKNTLLPT